MGWNFTFSNIRDDTQNGSTVETVAAEAGKDKNNKEGQVLILFMKTTKVQKVLQRGYKLARTLLDQSDFSNLHNSQM